MTQNLISRQNIIHQGILSAWTSIIYIIYLFGFTLVFFNLHCIHPYLPLW